jgi:hypothetical protein
MNVFFNERLKLDGSYWLPETTEAFDEVLSNFSSTLNSLKFYTEVVVHYSSEDMKILLNNFQQIADWSSLNSEAKINLIRALLLEVNAKDWNKHKLQRDDMIYLLQESVGQTTHSVNTTSLAEATEYKFGQQKVAVINLTHSEYAGSVPILVNRSSLNPPRAMHILELDTFKDNKDLVAHIIENWFQRTYNHNPKHGENGKNVKHNKGEDVSPLECSIEEASQLLKFAVSTRNKAELYVYDDPRKKFIVYKAESEHVYHGYHPIDQDEVPQEVKNFLLRNLE